MDDTKREIRFALLGDLPDADGLTEAFRTYGRQRVVASMASQFPDVPRYEHWQPLVADENVDAALLFLPGEEVLEAARQFAIRGKPVVISSRCELPSSLVAELALLDAEEAASIVPWYADRAMPVFQELRHLVAGGTLGSLTSLTFEQTVAPPSSEPAGTSLTDAMLQDLLMSHLDLLRWFGGDYSQVTVLQTGTTDQGFVSRTIKLGGEGLPDATCTYQRGGEHRLSIQILGTKGSAAIRSTNEGTRLEIDGLPVPLIPALQPDLALCLKMVDDSIARRPGALRWQDRVRVHEIQEAMQRSLKRRRTIDLHFEDASERSQFKTQMATVGCFVLVYTFFATVALLLVGAVFDPRDRIQRASEAAGFVISADGFEPGTGQLTPLAEERLRELANRWETSGAVVVIEQSSQQPDGAGPSPQDLQRLLTVRRKLTEHGVQRVEERTAVRPLAGRAFATLMNLGRVAAFAPLGLFLALQVLLFVTRPARSGPQSSFPSGMNSGS